jgi:hypothetical protein
MSQCVRSSSAPMKPLPTSARYEQRLLSLVPPRRAVGDVHDAVGVTAVRLMVQRSGADKIIARIIYTGPVRAPIEAGQQIGVIKVWRGETVALEAPLCA